MANLSRRYKFKGYTITCCGYHQPDHCVWWEAIDDNKCACFHGNTLREVEFMILDYEWEDKLKAKDKVIAELREKLDITVNSDRIDEILRIEETQRKELKRRYEIAKTAIREVQARMLHDGVTAGGGPSKQYWDILEMGFNGTYRNDYEVKK